MSEATPAATTTEEKPATPPPTLKAILAVRAVGMGHFADALGQKAFRSVAGRRFFSVVGARVSASLIN